MVTPYLSRLRNPARTPGAIRARPRSRFEPVAVEPAWTQDELVLEEHAERPADAPPPTAPAKVAAPPGGGARPARRVPQAERSAAGRPEPPPTAAPAAIPGRRGPARPAEPEVPSSPRLVAARPAAPRPTAPVSAEPTPGRDGPDVAGAPRVVRPARGASRPLPEPAHAAKAAPLAPGEAIVAPPTPPQPATPAAPRAAPPPPKQTIDRAPASGSGRAQRPATARLAPRGPVSPPPKTPARTDRPATARPSPPREPPVVSVTIGRVEVRSQPPAEAAPSTRQPAVSNRTTSLADYLRSRSHGRIG